MTETQNTCRFCGDIFNARHVETTICRSCYYAGRSKEEPFLPLIAQLKALPNVADAYVAHTGGGCFGLQVDLVDKRIAFATVCFFHENEWQVDACLPEAGGHTPAFRFATGDTGALEKLPPQAGDSARERCLAARAIASAAPALPARTQVKVQLALK